MAIRAPLALATTLILVLAFTAWPQDEKKEEPKAGGPGPGAVTSPEKLRELIGNLGYDKDLRLDGSTVHFIVHDAPHSNYTFEFLAALSKDNEKSRIWLWAGLKNLPDPDNPPPQILLKLLADNEQDHRFFSVNAKGLIQLNSSLPNSDVTPGKLLREMEAFRARLRKTETLWNPAKWPPAK